MGGFGFIFLGHSFLCPENGVIILLFCLVGFEVDFAIIKGEGVGVKKVYAVLVFGELEVGLPTKRYRGKDTWVGASLKIKCVFITRSNFLKINFLQIEFVDIQ